VIFVINTPMITVTDGYDGVTGYGDNHMVALTN
jgi:hypothetical protein